jgi:hypothetical protein
MWFQNPLFRLLGLLENAKFWKFIPKDRDYILKTQADALKQFKILSRLVGTLNQKFPTRAPQKVLK